MHAPLLLLGTVASTKDPLGRVQVDASFAGQTLKLPFIRVLQPLADANGGVFVVPEKGSTVIVLCGAGSEPEGMLVLGAVYGGDQKPKTPDGTDTNDVKQLLTRGGNQITITDKAGEESILVQTKDSSIKLLLDPLKGVTLEAEKDLVLTSRTGKITLKATDVMDLSGKDVNITATGNLTLKATGTALLDGNEATVKGKVGATLEATGKVEVNSVGVTLQGTLVEVK